MKKYLLLLLLATAWWGCSTFEKEDLYGRWKNDNWDFVFNEDGTMKIGRDGQYQPGDVRFRTVGNTLEITRDGKVLLSNLTVKSIDNNQLTLEFRNIIGNPEGQADNVQVLQRVE